MILHLIMAKLREQQAQKKKQAAQNPTPHEKTWSAWSPSPKHPSAMVKVTPKKSWWR